MTKLEQQAIALAGLFQACELVNDIAKTGQCDQTALETAISSLFVTSPETTLEVFGSTSRIGIGLRALQKIMQNRSDNAGMNSVRYALAIMHLEAKLRKNPPMLDTIGQRLSRAEEQVSHFGILHENIFDSLASLYSDTISTFSLRIQVNGDPNYLQMPANAAKIRSLLLAAIRAAILWRQVGGHRWQLIFKRKALAETAGRLLAAH